MDYGLGSGKVETFVINHRPPPSFQDDAPLVIAVVTLDEGARMMTNLINVEPDPEQIEAGMPVRIVYDDVTDEVTLPKFEPAG